MHDRTNAARRDDARDWLFDHFAGKVMSIYRQRQLGINTYPQ